MMDLRDRKDSLNQASLYQDDGSSFKGKVHKKFAMVESLIWNH